MNDRVTKTCTDCQRDLPLGAFARVRSDRPWLRSKCRRCVSAADPRRVHARGATS